MTIRSNATRNEIPLRCRCGAVRGVAHDASARTGNRVVCYCDDCQAFAFFLEAADVILDDLGGSDIFQMPPARLEITSGKDQLGCVRLRPGGLMRWHTLCCRTPVANTLASSQIPLAGVSRVLMDHEAHGFSRDDALGPVRDRVFGKFARGDASALGAHPTGSIASVGRMVGRMLVTRLRGLHSPSPFFVPATGQPIATPRVLSESELRQVIAARDAGGR